MPTILGPRPDDDPVVERLLRDYDELSQALDMLEYHGHSLAALIVRRERTNTLGLIGKWRAVHDIRLPF